MHWCCCKLDVVVALDAARGRARFAQTISSHTYVAWLQVAINSSYAALVLGVCVIVGFATGLDPQV